MEKPASYCYPYDDKPAKVRIVVTKTVMMVMMMMMMTITIITIMIMTNKNLRKRSCWLTRQLKHGKTQSLKQRKAHYTPQSSSSSSSSSSPIFIPLFPLFRPPLSFCFTLESLDNWRKKNKKPQYQRGNAAWYRIGNIMPYTPCSARTEYAELIKHIEHTEHKDVKWTGEMCRCSNRKPIKPKGPVKEPLVLAFYMNKTRVLRILKPKSNPPSLTPYGVHRYRFLQGVKNGPAQEQPWIYSKDKIQNSKFKNISEVHHNIITS